MTTISKTHRFRDYLPILLAVIGAVLITIVLASVGKAGPLLRRSEAATDITGYAMLGGATWTGWDRVSVENSITYEIATVDADASVTSIDVRCETTNDSTLADDAGADLPVLTSTAGTGITTGVISGVWRWVTSAGGGPGTATWTMTVSNIPNDFINCEFSFPGLPDAAIDTITVREQRRVDP